MTNYRRSRPATPPNATVTAVQGKTREQSSPVATQYTCSLCGIRYSVLKEEKPQCPLCREMHLVKQLRTALGQANAEIANLTNSVTNLSAQVSRISAMRQAVELLGDEDRTFLKSVMYRYREDPLITLQATHSSFGTGGTRDRFIVESRRTGNRAHESHTCTSAGGVAIVSYYYEEAREGGAKAAMKALMRAVGQDLAA